MKLRFVHPAIGAMACPIEDGATLVVGRGGPGVDVELAWDTRISRFHARVARRGSELWFEDLGSKNGSFVGETRVDERFRAKTSVAILIGDTVLELVDPNEVDDPTDATIEASNAEYIQALERIANAKPKLALVPTSDLESLRSDVQPVEVEKPKTRQTVRYVSPARVEVRAEDRGDLRRLWMRDISKGGLFVETAESLPLGSHVDVRIETPEGTVTVGAKVVHVITPAGGRASPPREVGVGAASGPMAMPPGMGLELTGLDDQKRKAIQRYVEGLAQRLEAALDSSGLSHGAEQAGTATQPTYMPVPVTPLPPETVAAAKRLLDSADNNDLYGAIDVQPTAGITTIERKIELLRALLDETISTVPAPQAARLNAAASVLDRIRRVLTSPPARLEYDFRRGHVRAAERVMLASQGNGPSVQTLRRTWNVVHPEKVERAAFLTRKAFTLRQGRKLHEAILAGRTALELNPFFLELEQTVAAWEKLKQNAD